MAARFSTGFSVALALVVLGFLSGCASVKSTEQYYIPYTMKTYPPKPPDAFIPIVGKPPREGYVTIGRLAFQSYNGWNFMRKSMIYNAQIHGADAVVLKDVSSNTQTAFYQVPPQFNYVPVTGTYCKNGKSYTYTNFIPVYQPGYLQPYTSTITAIDAEMIVLKK